MPYARAGKRRKGMPLFISDSYFIATAYKFQLFSLIFFVSKHNIYMFGAFLVYVASISDRTLHEYPFYVLSASI